MQRSDYLSYLFSIRLIIVKDRENQSNRSKCFVLLDILIFSRKDENMIKIYFTIALLRVKFVLYSMYSKLSYSLIKKDLIVYAVL
jgi:hypothetical protein